MVYQASYASRVVVLCLLWFNYCILRIICMSMLCLLVVVQLRFHQYHMHTDLLYCLLGLNHQVLEDFRDWYHQIIQGCFISTGAMIKFLNGGEETLKTRGKICQYLIKSTLQWRQNERDGVSNHLLLHCLLNRLFKHRTKKVSKLCVTGRYPASSPYNGPVTRKMFPFDEVIMIFGSTIC